MQMITYKDLPLELTVIGDTVNNRLALECWDMSSDGGLWFTLARDTDGTMLLVSAGRDIPLDLLGQVVVIAGTEIPAQ